MITKKYILKGTIAILLSTLIFSSCKKFMDVGTPKVEITSDLVFADDFTATNSLVSIYGDMMSSRNPMSLYNSWYLGYAADEFVGYGSPAPKYYTNALDPSVDDFWSSCYKYVYRANAVIEGVNKSTTLLDSTKTQLNGEALFVRAFSHFYLVNLFGDVPYITSTDYRANNLVVREPVNKVYEKIIADLLTARSLVKDYYPTANNKAYSSIGQVERVRPNKSVVTAMLARVYLYTGNWAQAEAEASSIINKTAVYSLPADLNAVFLKNSTETIWQLMPSLATNVNAPYAQAYVLIRTPGSGTTTLTDQLANAFETGDKRKTNWTATFSNASGTWRYPFKYKVSQVSNTPGTIVATEYNMVFRLSEQYLIRAEARANQNNMSGAAADVNMLRTRARDTSIPGALPNISTSLSKDACLTAIEHERQVELFTEFGHRWLDLKRTGRANQVLAPIKGASWQTTDQLFPIPKIQLDFDPNMFGAQNPGYN